MIKIPGQQFDTPEFLEIKSKAEAARQKLIDFVSKNPNEDFSVSKIYKDFKEFLQETHKNRCAFCESELETQYGDVEHYRPKKAVKTFPNGNKEDHPGYYWKAYDWDNFLLSCIRCNRTLKKNFFPIRKQRISRHDEEDLDGLEEPLILNPTKIDPVKHFRLDKKGNLIGTTEIGKTTVAVFNLNDRFFVKKRKRAFAYGASIFRDYVTASGNDNQDLLEERKSEILEIKKGDIEFCLAHRWGLLWSKKKIQKDIEAIES